MLIKILLILLVFCLLAAVVLFIFSGNKQTSLTNDQAPILPQSSAQVEPYSKIELTPANPTPEPSPLFSNLYPSNSKSSSGYARLSEVLGKILIQVKSDDLTVNNGMIFSGTCAQEGKITYPLVSFIEGKSQTTWDIKMNDLITKLPLSVKLFKDTKSIIDYSYCADIKLP